MWKRVEKGAKEWLSEITSDHFLVQSAAANYLEPMFMEQMPVDGMEMTVYGGFTEARGPSSLS